MISLNQIVLHTRNVPTLTAFLSDLLEMEIIQEPGNDSVLLKQENYQFLILESSADQLFAKETKRDIWLDFSLDSLEELENLLQKIKFQQYRHGESGEDVIKLQKDDSFCFFVINDPDGRALRFSFRE